MVIKRGPAAVVVLLDLETVTALDRQTVPGETLGETIRRLAGAVTGG